MTVTEVEGVELTRQKMKKKMNNLIFVPKSLYKR